MVGTMVDSANQRRVVKGHGVKGRWHKTKLEALENPTMLANARWQIFLYF
jgi:hypothetical protein